MNLAGFHAARLFGGRDYQRFVILAHARTGSNLLMSLLQSHRAVYMRPEVLSRKRGRSVDEIVSNVYRRMPPWIRAVGFKVFYYHPVDGDPVQVRRYLCALPGLRVIHLTRRNALRTIVSWSIAKKTGQWSRKAGEGVLGRPEHVVRLQRPDLEERFVRIKDWEKHCPQEFGPCPVLDVCYEDLVEDHGEWMHRIFEFLGLPEQAELKTSFRRQNPQPLRELIENYDELHEAFAGSPWSQYFEDVTQECEQVGAVV